MNLQYKWKVVEANVENRSLVVEYSTGYRETVTRHLRLPNSISEIEKVVQMNAPYLEWLLDAPQAPQEEIQLDIPVEDILAQSGEGEISKPRIPTAEEIQADIDERMRRDVSKVLFELGVTEVDLYQQKLAAASDTSAS